MDETFVVLPDGRYAIGRDRKLHVDLLEDNFDVKVETFMHPDDARHIRGLFQSGAWFIITFHEINPEEASALLQIFDEINITDQDNVHVESRELDMDNSIGEFKKYLRNIINFDTDTPRNDSEQMNLFGGKGTRKSPEALRINPHASQSKIGSAVWPQYAIDTFVILPDGRYAVDDNGEYHSVLMLDEFGIGTQLIMSPDDPRHIRGFFENGSWKIYGYSNLNSDEASALLEIFENSQFSDHHSVEGEIGDFEFDYTVGEFKEYLKTLGESSQMEVNSWWKGAEGNIEERWEEAYDMGYQEAISNGDPTMFPGDFSTGYEYDGYMAGFNEGQYYREEQEKNPDTPTASSVRSYEEAYELGWEEGLASLHLGEPHPIYELDDFPTQSYYFYSGYMRGLDEAYYGVNDDEDEEPDDKDMSSPNILNGDDFTGIDRFVVIPDGRYAVTANDLHNELMRDEFGIETSLLMSPDDPPHLRGVKYDGDWAIMSFDPLTPQQAQSTAKILEGIGIPPEETITVSIVDDDEYMTVEEFRSNYVNTTKEGKMNWWKSAEGIPIKSKAQQIEQAVADGSMDVENARNQLMNLLSYASDFDYAPIVESIKNLNNAVPVQPSLFAKQAADAGDTADYLIEQVQSGVLSSDQARQEIQNQMGIIDDENEIFELRSKLLVLDQVAQASPMENPQVMQQQQEIAQQNMPPQPDMMPRQAGQAWWKDADHDEPHMVREVAWEKGYNEGKENAIMNRYNMPSLVDSEWKEIYGEESYKNLYNEYLEGLEYGFESGGGESRFTRNQDEIDDLNKILDYSNQKEIDDLNDLLKNSWWKGAAPPHLDPNDNGTFDLRMDPGDDPNDWTPQDKNFRVGDEVLHIPTGQGGHIEETLDVDRYSVMLDDGDIVEATADDLQHEDNDSPGETHFDNDQSRFIGDDPEAQNFEDPTFATGEYIDDHIAQLQVGDKVRVCLIEEGQELFCNMMGTVTDVRGDHYEVEVEGNTDTFPRNAIELMPTNYNPHYGGNKTGWWVGAGQYAPPNTTEPDGTQNEHDEIVDEVLDDPGDAEGQYEQRITLPWLEENFPQEKLVNNLLYAYENSTEEDRTEGIEWYNSVHEQAQQFADTYGYGFEQVCAVFAALSPNLYWDTNFVQAIAFIEAHANGTANSWEEVRIWTPYSYEGKPCGYGKNNTKAWQILETGDTGLVKGEKVESFFHNFVNGPNDPDTRATVDIWATRVAFLDPLVKPNIAEDGSYQYLEKAYNTAAEQVGLTAKQFQAVVWVYYKKLHGRNRGPVDYVDRYRDYISTPFKERGAPDPSQLRERPEDRERREKGEKSMEESYEAQRKNLEKERKRVDRGRRLNPPNQVSKPVNTLDRARRTRDKDNIQDYLKRRESKIWWKGYDADWWNL